MFSAIVIVADASAPQIASPEAIARTLSALVPAAIEGLIRDSVVASPAPNPAAREIADHAGCAFATADDVAGVLAAGLAMARGDWIMAIRAGFAPRAGFAEEVSDLFLNGAAGGPRLALLRAEPNRLLTRLAPFFAPIVGVLGPRSSFNPGARGLADWTRRAGRAPSLRGRWRRVV